MNNNGFQAGCNDLITRGGGTTTALREWRHLRLPRPVILGDVDPVLEQALAPVLRDLARVGIAPVRIDGAGWTGDPERPSAMLWSSDGSAMGVAVVRASTEAERIACAADMVQEWAIEELWGHRSTNWPPCPRHPETHPMSATRRDDVALWICPVDRKPIAAIGSL